MIDRLRAYLKQTLWCDESTVDLLAAYVVLCHLAPLEIFSTVPYLDVRGPSGSGKTTLGLVLAGLTGGEVSAGQTAAALLRMLDQSPGRLMVLDEGESVLSGIDRREFSAILLNGDRVDGKVKRANRNDQVTNVTYRVFGPKAVISIPGINRSALLRRAIWVELEPHPMNFVSRRDVAEEASLRDALGVGAQDLVPQVRANLEVHLASEAFLSPAHRLLWAPMLAVADAVGLDLKGVCAAQGEVLEQKVGLDLVDALEGLLASLPPAKYRLTDLRHHLTQRYGQKAALWSEERIGRALRRLGREVRKDSKGRWIQVHPPGLLNRLLRRAG